MAERTFNCPDCGALIKTTTANKQRCRACSEARHREQAREGWAKREQRRLAGIEPKPRNHYQFGDSEENIKKCLSCERKKCNNCLSPLVGSKGRK